MCSVISRAAEVTKITLKTTVLPNVQSDNKIEIWLLEEEGFKSTHCRWCHLVSTNGNCRSTLINARKGICDLFAPMILTLTQWPSYMNLTCIPWRYTGCAKMSPLRQVFQILSSDRHTCRQTDMTKIIYHTASQVVKSNNNRWSVYGTFIATRLSQEFIWWMANSVEQSSEFRPSQQRRDVWVCHGTTIIYC